ncbi:MAG TPA: hypothetical protein VGN00_05655 [Puia sp.]|jgi:uncharacterized protein (DUF697 family)
MNPFNIYKTSLFVLLVTGLSLAACKKKNDFIGHDNYITSFSLKKADMTFTAAITDSSIIVTVPDGFSLDSAVATVAVSENASIYPKPSSIVQWDDEALFVVDAHNGEAKSYRYTVTRSAVPVNGSVVLATQADVDAFGKMGATGITGNLIIGAPAGTDSVTSLAALFNLKKIGYSLIIYPTYSATGIVGLDNLQSIGTDLKVEGVNNLVELVLPSLATTGSISVNNPLTETITFPKLTHVAGSLAINAPLNRMTIPNLRQVDGDLSLTTDPSSGAALIQDLAFPVLTSVGSVAVSNFRQTIKLDLPSLTALTTGDLNVSNMTALYDLNCPVLQTTKGIITIPDPFVATKLTQISFPALTQTGGVNIGINSLNVIDFPALATISGSLQINAGYPYNSTLTSLDGFAALKNAQSIGITGQSALTSFKGLQGVIPNITAAGWTAWGNAYNPAYEDLAAGKWTN